MNKHLQTILNFLQQAESLKPEEKKLLENAIRESDKEITITEFKLERTEKVKKTTAILLEETIAELEQKRKSVEAQNRELEIEASLERVRAQAMNMRKPDDLLDICEVLFNELKLLGFQELRNAMINIYDDDHHSFINYDYSDTAGRVVTHHAYTSHPVIETQVKQVRSSNDAFSETIFTGKDLDDWKLFRKKKGEPEDPKVDDVTSLFYYFYSIGTGAIGVSTYSSLSEENRNVLKRFRNVFDFAYRRYTDVTQAEAQAKEAQIEASMERVRSRTMAMHKSAELAEVAVLLYHELKALGVSHEFFECGYIEMDEANNLQRAWSTRPDGSFLEEPFYLPLKGEPVIDARYDAWLQRIPVFYQKVGGDQWHRHLEFILPFFGNKDAVEISTSSIIPDPVHFYFGNFDHGMLNINCGMPLSDEAELLFARFTRVFEMTYKRFLDLQKAEAQAREAQIQLALERVRARTMAMHHSNELADTATILFQQIKELGYELWSCGFGIWKPEVDLEEAWMSTGDSFPIIRVPFREDPTHLSIYEASQRGESVFQVEVKGEVLTRHYDWLMSQPSFKLVFGQIENSGTILPTVQYKYAAFFKQGYLHLITTQPQPDINNISKRFAKVFEQTYTRFKDLERAEAQAREAQIEAALEKVRSRTMAMQRSEELPEVAALLFQQVKTLGVPQFHCGFNIFEIDDKECTWYPGSADGDILPPCKIPLTEHPVFIAFNESRKRGDELFVYEKEGEYQADHYRYMLSLPVLGEILQNMLDAGIPFPTFQIDHIANFSHGNLLFITSEHFPEMHDTFKRFAKVFEQTYTRFLDLQKAEAQAREAQIEAALERIRSSAMAMHSSEGILDVTQVLREQIAMLGEKELESILVHIYHEDTDQFEAWYSYRHPESTEKQIRNGRQMLSWSQTARARKDKEKYHEESSDYCIVADYKMLEEWYGYLLATVPEVVEVNADGKPLIPDVLYYNYSKITGGALLLITNSEASDHSKYLLRRAAMVFNLAYSRFLDLQKAEAQAREAKIEAALERVRSRSMGMHKSAELKDVIKIVYQQLIQLKINLDHAGFVVDYVPGGDWHFWIADEQDIPSKITHPYFESIWANQFNEAKEKGVDLFVTNLNFEEKNRFYKELLSYIPGLSETSKDFYLNCPGLAATTVLFENVSLYIENFSGTPYTDEENKIFFRFGIVFQQTYTRFLDLQKAEAQARQAQIELGLERVRAKAMAMKHTSELSEVISTVFQELTKLNFSPTRTVLWLFDETNISFEAWMANSENDKAPASFQMAIKHAWHLKIFNAWRARKTKWVHELKGDEKRSLDDYLFTETLAANLPDEVKAGIRAPERIINSFSFHNFGGLQVDALEKLTEENLEILFRFSKDFDLAYTRFLDLQKAENQAREATIEAALERVRAKAMAMHSSEDLSATIAIFYRELESFSITPRRCGLGLLDKETRTAELSTMNTIEQGDSIDIVGTLKMQGHPVLEGVFDNWILQQEYRPVLRGNEIKEYYQLLRPQVAFPEYPNDAVQYGYFFFFPEGGVYAWTEKEMTEDELKIYRRFTSVLSLTYKRYKDLKDAEARARIAIRESSLDRVRAGIASMRNAEDLQRITPLVWHELTTLGVPFFRCGVFIMSEEEGKIHMYLSTPEGRPLAALHLGFDTSEINKIAVAHWRSQKVYTDHWNKEQFTAFAKSLLEQGQIQTTNTYQGGAEPPESLTLQFIPFAQGMLYVGSVEPLSASQIELVQVLAEAFSVAYARYEDFTKLESAKQQIEKTLVDLKQTQAQLVQSEKMASLGELTAGIAHEIQNPLNFVNNFSEVNKELLTEMKEEIEKGHFDEVKEIINDVISNEEKITHHGKRADVIVKGMLQHSRSSSGVKELTDINELADEYLRLAYHGLRAKDKSFNATMNKDFDESLEKIAVVPQDIGRVILNLITNAFYAVTEKKKTADTSYEPTITVSTKKIGNQVAICVKDNGNGIPKKVLDKIFQPFFTTKPTGQGTGLGLSLSYDIVKAHGGDIKVETNESEGSEFVMQLPINAN